MIPDPGNDKVWRRPESDLTRAPDETDAGAGQTEGGAAEDSTSIQALDS